MFNGYNRVLHGSLRPSLISPNLTFHTACCYREISISHVLRREGYRHNSQTCCDKAYHVSTAQRLTAAPRARSQTPTRDATIRLSSAWWPAPVVHFGCRNVRADLCGRPRHFHATARASAPPNGLPPKPSKPSTPSKPANPAQPSLPSTPLRATPSRGPLPSLPSADPIRMKQTKGVGTLIKSPLEERREEQERAVKEEAAQKERDRLEQIANDRKKAEDELRQREERDRIQRQQRVEQERQDRQRQQAADRRTKVERAWRQKLSHAQEISRLVESFEFTDTTAIDEYLRVRLLKERASEFERRMDHLQGKGGLYAHSRTLSDKLGAGDLSDDPTIEWIHSFLRGQIAVENRERYALLNIWSSLTDAGEMTQLLQGQLHLHRLIMRVHLQVSFLPEVFRYCASGMQTEMLMLNISENMRSMNICLHKLSSLAFFQPPGKANLSRRALENARLQYGQVNALRNLAFRDRASKTEISTTAFEEAYFERLSRLSPYQDHFNSLRDTMKYYLEITMPSKMSNQVRSDQPRARRLKTLGLWSVTTDNRIDIIRSREIVLLWTAIAMLTSPVYARMVKQPASRTLLSPRQRAPVPSISIPAQQPVSSTIVPWRESTNLYPLRLAVPIYYVTNTNGLHSVLPQFAKSKTLAFDTFEVVHPDATHHVAFLMLATESHIALLHLANMFRRELVRARHLDSVLDDSNVVKVGIDLESQRQALRNEFSIEVENVLELRDVLRDDAKAPEHVLGDHHGRTLSAMAARVLGEPLPIPDVQGSSKNVFHEAIHDQRDAPEPIQLIQYLASRAYAVLQMYHVLTQHQNTQSSTHKPLESGGSPQLGPVLVHAPSGVPGSRKRMLYVGRLAKYMADRKLWQMLQRPQIKLGGSRLQRLADNKKAANEVAAKMGSKNGRRMTNRLTAYYLFTTFQEPLPLIQDLLGIPMLATAILHITQHAQLPLRDHDRNELESWRIRNREEDVWQSLEAEQILRSSAEIVSPPLETTTSTKLEFTTTRKISPARTTGSLKSSVEDRKRLRTRKRKKEGVATRVSTRRKQKNSLSGVMATANNFTSKFADFSEHLSSPVPAMTASASHDGVEARVPDTSIRSKSKGTLTINHHLAQNSVGNLIRYEHSALAPLDASAVTSSTKDRAGSSGASQRASGSDVENTVRIRYGALRPGTEGATTLKARRAARVAEEAQRRREARQRDAQKGIFHMRRLAPGTGSSPSGLVSEVSSMDESIDVPAAETKPEDHEKAWWD